MQTHILQALKIIIFGWDFARKIKAQRLFFLDVYPLNIVCVYAPDVITQKHHVAFLKDPSSKTT